MENRRDLITATTKEPEDSYIESIAGTRMTAIYLVTDDASPMAHCCVCPCSCGIATGRACLLSAGCLSGPADGGAGHLYDSHHRHSPPT